MKNKIDVNTLQYAIDTIKRQDKWSAVEELSSRLFNELEKLEQHVN